MLALQLVIGVGIALLFPLLVYSGVATFSSPPKPSNRTNLVPETSEEAKEANREQIRREQEELRRARVAYAKLLFTVMAPAGFVAVLAGYLIGVSAIGIGLLSGGILCMVYGYTQIEPGKSGLAMMPSVRDCRPGTARLLENPARALVALAADSAAVELRANQMAPNSKLAEMSPYNLKGRRPGRASASNTSRYI
jgi:hypothetical protein